MFAHRRKDEFLTRQYLWLWAGLAFQAGSVNAGGFLACSRFVSHMTGFGTQVGISLSQLDYRLAFEMFSAPASFLLGAMISGWLIDRPMIRLQPPRYLTVMLALVFTFFFVAVGGTAGIFGEFGEPLLFDRDFFLMSVLCAACGLQNACFGSLTRGQIRTTHLTGILTDIGTTIVKLRYIPSYKRETKRMRRMNAIRVLTFVCFSSGSAFSAFLFGAYGYAGFGFVTAFSSFLFGVVFYRTRVQARFTREQLAKRSVLAELESTGSVPSRPSHAPAEEARH